MFWLHFIAKTLPNITMKVLTIFIFLIINLPSFSQEYSDWFLESLSSSSIEVRNDSLVFLDQPEEVIVKIPTNFPKNENVTLADNQGQVVIIKRINYTDIIFKIENGLTLDSGTATLSPHFHLGAESEGSLFYYNYFANSSISGCIDYLGIGIDSAFVIPRLASGCEGIEINESMAIKK